MTVPSGVIVAGLCLIAGNVICHGIASAQGTGLGKDVPPIVFDAGTNRDGFHTYIIHGYLHGVTATKGSSLSVKVSKRVSKKTGMEADSRTATIEVLDLTCDSVQATLTMQSAGTAIVASPVTATCAQLPPNQIEISINYTLVESVTVNQFQYTLMMASKEPNYSLLDHFPTKSTWSAWKCSSGPCEKDPVQLAMIWYERGRLHISNERGNSGGDVNFDAASRTITVASWGKGTLSEDYNSIDWVDPKSTWVRITDSRPIGTP
jgi:hypothetical protein